MKKFIFLTFGFLAWAFYEESGGADFVPRKADLMAAAAQAQAADDAARAVAEAKSPIPAPQAAPVAEPVVVSADAALSAKGTPEAVALVSVNLREAPAEQPTDTPPEITLVSLQDSGDLFARPLQQLADQGASPATPGVVLRPEPAVDLRQVTGTRVNMRTGPGTDFAILGSLVQGDEVEVIADEGIGWVKLRTGDGRVGWMADFLLSDPAG